MYQYIKNSEEVEKWVVENYEKIRNGGIPIQKSVEFSLDGWNGATNTKRRGLFATLHNTNLDNFRVINDDLFFEPNDIYNFEKWNLQNFQEKNIANNINNLIRRIYAKINNVAQEQQEAGQLENILLSIPLYYTKDEIKQLRMSCTKKRNYCKTSRK